MSHDDPLQLLLIEDNPGDARYITELLQEATELSARVRSQEVGDGQVFDEDGTAPTIHHESRLEAGLNLLDEVAVDVVLLDLDLPDSEGLETLSTTLDRASAPVVVLTGLRDRERGLKALRSGADEYLVKDEVNSDLLIRTVYHAVERRAHLRELKRYEVLIEESTDVNAVVDLDGTIQYVTPSVETVLGYEPGELTGENGFEYVHPDDREGARKSLKRVLETDDAPSMEFRFEHRDGSWVVLEVRGRDLREEELIDGIVLYTTDVTERKRREEQLAQQREELAALNQLNGVVQEITHRVIESATREELERAVCEALAGSDSYSFAWIGEVDAASEKVVVRTEAGVEDYLGDVEITVDDGSTGQGPTGRAIRTGTIQVARNVHEDPDYEPWWDHAEEHGIHSSAAIPFVHDGMLYGVLNVYSDRRYAFGDDERAVIGQLGQVVGHAITAIERKQALMSEEVIEVKFVVQNYLDSLGVAGGTDDSISFERVVPLGDDRYAVYGRAGADAIDVLDAVREHDPSWESVTVLSEGGDEIRFELTLSGSTMLTAIASAHGRVHRATIEDGALEVTVHLPPGANVRSVVDTMQEAYPMTQLLAQRRTERRPEAQVDVRQAFDEQLTLRQQSALEAAYFSGFFEWPRDSSGEDVAESLDVSAPTFHQHLRAAERKLLEAVFEASDTER
ncbi:PAS domain S-box protein [Halorarum halophilum]|uniref:PAS domain S-box protein n=1 Tax=Halorarum halophilum TaxID=2743090 RepID=A0A7D5GIJ0_9EURY|nr:bacterio-opsin activator domain-containing protein [Halobaculum halophilum]QLG28211.1 PAS domain S-box protein [Halobaculum halophilum]